MIPKYRPGDVIIPCVKHWKKTVLGVDPTLSWYTMRGFYGLGVQEHGEFLENVYDTDNSLDVFGYELGFMSRKLKT